MAGAIFPKRTIRLSETPEYEKKVKLKHIHKIKKLQPSIVKKKVTLQKTICSLSGQVGDGSEKKSFSATVQEPLIGWERLHTILSLSVVEY